MPLGNLTSQFLANVYLNELDYFVKHKLKAKYYIRYVDDFFILSSNKEELNDYMLKINNFLRQNLRLELHKDKSKILPLSQGIDLLGFKNFYNFKLLRKRNIRKINRKLSNFINNKSTKKEIMASFLGWNGYAKQANTYKLRKNILSKINRKINKMPSKLLSQEEIPSLISKLKGKVIVTTNGSFDILHPAHIRLLEKAKKEGDILIVLLNSDLSLKGFKGEKRPILQEKDRSDILSALESVNYILIFNEDTPLNILSKIRPNKHVKGGSFIPERIAKEKSLLESWGGELITFPLEKGYSTTSIIEKIENASKK